MDRRLVKFRWVIPARDQIILKMKFISDEVGQIDQVCMYIVHVQGYTLHCIDIYF